ncbi:MAG: dihydropteroate synthase [Rhodospirillales bacterium]|jgi:dihydropteroate synthase|nr:dihydropteroate synthase [Rhodospirillales bacterium]MBT4041316.1 dihydropteroate synthase [Rhodospirillales bacterium]MBT4625735.1 dihydropteroate synthase [Rhodospirillales bacterium]MBT5352716.1 dihydropteroate synthase [Rhodospirillales bacterium]MBT5521629.1 dihydropteroate synthase [Rhodospirillales bacterium]
MTEQTFAGLALSHPLIMGIVNVTPDSFSDGGDAYQMDDAIAHGLLQIDQGAHIVDIGGESTRPGAAPVPEAEEIARVVPVVKALADTGAVVSIDTRHANVMQAAIDAGAKIVNDVTALEGDPRSLEVVAKAGVSLCLMHMQGEPQTMQKNPTYGDVVAEIRDYLNARVAACEAAGIDRSEIAIDPGIGFGKTIDHNLTLVNELDAFGDMGCPVLLGLSRKSFIARLSRGEEPKDRMPGSLAGALAGVARGASILRVHDVADTCQAVAVWQAISQAE